MAGFRCVLFVILISYVSCINDLAEQLKRSSKCYGAVTDGQCPTGEVALVRTAIAGAKNRSAYDYSNITGHYTCDDTRTKCCEQEPGDCVGDYRAYRNESADLFETDHFIYHKDCIGKQTCDRRLTARMDTKHLNCTDIGDFNTETVNIVTEYYCISKQKIRYLNGGRIEAEESSMVYLWYGQGETYNELPVNTYACSIEAECNGRITIVSLDFRFAQNDSELTCIPENTLEIQDGSHTKTFNCTSNNHFQIQELYTSNSSYIVLTYRGVRQGGYLWLGFKSTSGKLHIDCPKEEKQDDCPSITASTTLIIIIAVCCVAVLLVCIIFVYCLKRKPKNKTSPKKFENDVQNAMFNERRLPPRNLPPLLSHLPSEHTEKRKKKKKHKHKENGQEIIVDDQEKVEKKKKKHKKKEREQEFIIDEDEGGHQKEKKKKKKKKRSKQLNDENESVFKTTQENGGPSHEQYPTDKAENSSEKNLSE